MWEPWVANVLCGVVGFIFGCIFSMYLADLAIKISVRKALNEDKH